MTKYEDKEILDLKIGGMKIVDMTALGFLGWISKKINGVSAYTAANQELIMAVTHAPLSNVMAPEEKIRLCRKLEALGIELI